MFSLAILKYLEYLYSSLVKPQPAYCRVLCTIMGIIHFNYKDGKTRDGKFWYRRPLKFLLNQILWSYFGEKGIIPTWPKLQGFYKDKNEIISKTKLAARHSLLLIEHKNCHIRSAPFPSQGTYSSQCWGRASKALIFFNDTTDLSSMHLPKLFKDHS